MQSILKIRSGMANSVDPDQTAPSGALIRVYTICICHFSENLVYEILGHLLYNMFLCCERSLSTCRFCQICALQGNSKDLYSVVFAFL